MKYIKYLFIIFSLLFLWTTENVFAQSDQFYEGESVTGAYLKKFKPGASSGKYEQMKIFRRVSDNAPAYCIELWETLGSYQDLPAYQENYPFYAGISEAAWNRIQLISYYGYGYGNHTEDRWYAASQFLIWKTLEPNSTIYFTDTLNGNRASKFESEMQEIESLILRHSTVPSFGETPKKEKFLANGTYSYSDTNQVLHDYELTFFDSGISCEIQTDTLVVHASKPGTYSCAFHKKKEANRSLLYVSSTGQDLIVRGDYPVVSTTFQIQIEGGRFRFRKVDQETKQTEPQGMASFEGTVYGLYDTNHRLIEKISFYQEGELVLSSYLPYGTYYVKELESGKGYLLDPLEHEITLDQEEVSIDLLDQVYKGKVLLHKLYGSGNFWQGEYQAKFEIYDDEDQLYTTIVTNSSGFASVELPYGQYRFHQVAGKTNYEYVEDFFVDLTDLSRKEFSFELKNSILTRYLQVQKKDLETRERIPYSHAQFRIFHLDTEEYISYVKNGKRTTIFETDSNGMFLTPEPLPAGNYRLEEVKAPEGYLPLQESILFSISEDTAWEEVEDYGKTIFLEVFNSKKKGSLSLKKVDADTGEFLPQATFSLYTEDGTWITDLTTDENGSLFVDSLPYGKYYLLEIESPEGYQLSQEKIPFTIQEEGKVVSLVVSNTMLLPPKTDVTISKKDVKHFLLSEIWLGTMGLFFCDSSFSRRKKAKENC